MTRRPDWIGPRREFPASVRNAVRERSQGVCEWAGGACDQIAVEIDHVIPDALGGKPTLENAAHLCAGHHASKTALDTKMIAKADRVGGRSGQAKRRKERGASIPKRANAWPPKGARKLKSRKFNEK